MSFRSTGSSSSHSPWYGVLTFLDRLCSIVASEIACATSESDFRSRTVSFEIVLVEKKISSG